MEKLQLQTNANIVAMVNDISSSVAFIQGVVDEYSWESRMSHDGKAIAGYTSIWPLKFALSVKTLSEEQTKHILGQLNFMERRLGL